MDIEIRRLSPDLLEDYLYFFENVAHEDNEEEDRCYCVCWCSEDHRKGQDFSSPEKRRAYAMEYIRSGVLQGYLAYRDGQVVGWCNANTKSECLHCISWLRFMPPVKTGPVRDEKVKAVFCFTVAPNMRRKGIARQLLERVCRDAADDGFDVVEAYPNKGFVNVFRDFVGPWELYKKCGFSVQEEWERKYVVRKRLR